MSNYLRTEKMLYRHGHPFRNQRPFTEQEKLARRQVVDADRIRKSAIGEGLKVSAGGYKRKDYPSIKRKRAGQ